MVPARPAWKTLSQIAVAVVVATLPITAFANVDILDRVSGFDGDDDYLQFDGRHPSHFREPFTLTFYMEPMGSGDAVEPILDCGDLEIFLDVGASITLRAELAGSILVKATDILLHDNYDVRLEATESEGIVELKLYVDEVLEDTASGAAILDCDASFYVSTSHPPGTELFEGFLGPMRVVNP